MDTFAMARASRATIVTVTTGRTTEFVDITASLDAFIAAAHLRVGIVNVHTRHTTAAIVVNEHEPLLLGDFQEFLQRLVPAGRPCGHDDMSRRTNVEAGEPANGRAHCRALLLPTGASLNVIDGRLALGRWQRVFLVELDGPRTREISIVVIGESQS